MNWGFATLLQVTASKSAETSVKWRLLDHFLEDDRDLGPGDVAAYLCWRFSSKYDTLGLRLLEEGQHA